jgi:predicted ATPase
LGPDGWQSDHPLMVAFTLERATCELYAGNLDEVERLVQSALVNAQSRLERALCHRVGIDLHTTRGEMMAALEDAIDCLRLYGLQLTPHPAVDEVEAVGREVAERLGSRSPESLIELPLGDDADIEAELDVLAGMLPSAYFADLHLHRLIACHLVGLTLTHGVFAASSMGFSAYGFELANQQRYAEADRYGRVGLALVERHNFAAYRAKVCNLMGAAISVWTRDLQASIRFSRDGVRAGKENGDVLFACLNWLQVVVLRLAAGDPLDEVDREADEAIAFVRAARFEPLADVSVLVQQLVRSLQGRTDDQGSLSGDGFDEAAFVERLPVHPLPLIHTWYHLYALEARV